MNGVHDMGGMHGMGPIAPEADEPVFHEPWEARVFALNRATAALGKWNIDAGRHARERIPPADYLRMSYYEKWLAGLVTRLEESGLVTRAELESGRPTPGAVVGSPRISSTAISAALPRPGRSPTPHKCNPAAGVTGTAGSPRPGRGAAPRSPP